MHVHLQVKYALIAKVVNRECHEHNSDAFPHERNGESCRQKEANMEKTYKAEYKRGRQHEAQMKMSGKPTDGQQIGVQQGNNWQMFDE